jgi:hypothetical protein
VIIGAWALEEGWQYGAPPRFSTPADDEIEGLLVFPLLDPDEGAGSLRARTVIACSVRDATSMQQKGAIWVDVNG